MARTSTPAVSESYAIHELASILYRHERDDPDAARLSRLLAYLDHQSLWYELFREGIADDTPLWLREMILWSTHTCVHDWTLVPLNTAIYPQHYWYAFNSVAASIDEGDWDSLGHLKSLQTSTR